VKGLLVVEGFACTAMLKFRLLPFASMSASVFRGSSQARQQGNVLTAVGQPLAELVKFTSSLLFVIAY
jgi:hypothetical protein